MSSSSFNLGVSAGNSNRLSLERELEEELQLELKKLEEIFIHEHQEDTSDPIGSLENRPTRSKLSYSAYEYAQAEGEKEELQDKLQLLLSKTEEFDSQLCELNSLNLDLKAENKVLQLENGRLKKQLQCVVDKVDTPSSPTASSKHSDCSQDIVLKLAEVQAKLIKIEQECEDRELATAVAVRELEHERMMRIHIEKERDAYSAAYEASINHFEKWTKTKKTIGTGRTKS